MLIIVTNNLKTLNNRLTQMKISKER